MLKVLAWTEIVQCLWTLVSQFPQLSEEAWKVCFGGMQGFCFVFFDCPANEIVSRLEQEMNVTQAGRVINRPFVKCPFPRVWLGKVWLGDKTTLLPHLFQFFFFLNSGNKRNYYNTYESNPNSFSQCDPVCLNVIHCTPPPSISEHIPAFHMFFWRTY